MSESEKRMPIGGHLEELRLRLIVCIVGVFLATIVAYIYSPTVFYPMLRAPLDAVQGREAENPFVLRTPLLDLLARQRAAVTDEPQAEAEPIHLHYQSLIVPFVVRLKVALVIGILIALPLIIFQFWAFVSAGLYPSERRYVYRYGPGSFLLFVAGALFAYFVVLPLGVVFLLRQGDLFDLQAIITIDRYAPFVMWLILGFGLIFQMPLVAVFMTKIGVLGPAELVRWRKVAVVAVFVLAAVFTPPDPFTQIAMALAMVGLYEFSILLARLAARGRRDAQSAAE